MIERVIRSVPRGAVIAQGLPLHENSVVEGIYPPLGFLAERCTVLNAEFLDLPLLREDGAKFNRR
jgi:hypothetical protein